MSFFVGNLKPFVVYYESRKRELNTKKTVYYYESIKRELKRRHWVGRGTGTRKDKDEVNRRELCECEG